MKYVKNFCLEKWARLIFDSSSCMNLDKNKKLTTYIFSMRRASNKNFFVGLLELENITIIICK